MGFFLRPRLELVDRNHLGAEIELLVGSLPRKGQIQSNHLDLSRVTQLLAVLHLVQVIVCMQELLLQVLESLRL